MKLRRRRLTTATSSIVLAGGAVLLVVSAVFASGFSVEHVNLDDGGIWVTSNADHLFGRLNKPAGQLDAAFYPPGGAQDTSDLDIVQQGAAVAAWDKGSGVLYPVDVGRGVPAGSDGAPIAAADQVELAGGTLAVLDPASGAVWAQRVDTTKGISSLAGVDPSAKKLATVGVAGRSANAALAVGQDGTVYAVSSAGRVATIQPAGSGFAPVEYSQLDHGVQAVTATAVGNRLVVVDPSTGTVVVPGGPVATLNASTGRAAPDAAVVPQEPGPAANDVLLATPTALVSVDLSDGTVKVLTAARGGTPAAPVRLDNCVHAAWGGQDGGYVRSCSGGPATPVALAGNLQLVTPRFRVNRDAIVLNDLQTGAVWDLSNQRRVDDWKSVKPPPINVKKGNKNSKDPAYDGRTLPPKAVDDTLGARPGRTTLLHVLDNDSDPSGAILAIAGVTAPDNAHVHLAIAPDGQTVAAQIPNGAGTVHFKYTVSDGKLTATANVTVEIRGPGDNKAPETYPGFKPRTWTVPAGGHLQIPVTQDWRDYDGDPVGLVNAAVLAGSASTTPDGAIDYIAPAKGGTQVIRFAVTDSIAAPVTGTVTVVVQPPTATNAVAPTTQPDVARGQVRQPITIHPLDNDLPGADPSDPSAKLQLAGDLASPAGTTVTTDLETGAVVVTAARPGAYSLTYKVAFGNAPFATGKIRVDVVPDPTSPPPPVAMPDSGVLHGQQPSTIDVLANDFDPSGGVLVVSHAAPADPSSHLEVAIVSGHWLRINATDGVVWPTPQVVTYTVTDGLTSPVTGEVTVAELPADASTTPVTNDDYTTVRAGDEVTVPVLDNDTNPAGARMTLLQNVDGAPGPGRLVVTAATGSGPTGAAYVDGSAVRFVAPSSVRAQQQEVVDYVATDADGDRTDGKLHVTVVPLPGDTQPDRPPKPQPIEARAVAGQTITVQIPTTGVDPDGDAVTVAGIADAPALGRILRFNATSLTYQAYPTSAGTESFTYVVTDRYGQQGSATIRIGVVEPDLPQPPVAVDDQVAAAPGAHVHINVLANDLIATGDAVTMQPLTQADASLAGYLVVGGDQAARGFVEAVAPPADGVPLVVRYRISDGVNPPSEGILTVRGVDGADMPPVVADAYPSVNTATKAVSVDVSKYVLDPDGSVDDVTLNKVFDASATSGGMTVSVPAGAAPKTVSYEVKDSGGATAVGLIHVPAYGAGFPYVRPGASIAVPTSGSRTVVLSDVIVDPAGKPVRLTTTDKMAASPADQLKIANKGATSIVLTAGDYKGPGAVTVEVTDGKTLTDPDGHTVSLNIPVQVGPSVPVLRCPADPLTVIEGGSPVTVDVTTVCHVWAADQTTLPGLRYTATWQKTAPDVTLSGSGTHRLTLTADSAATPDATGTLVIGVEGSDAGTSTLSVVVRPARPPSVGDVRRTTNAGRPLTLDFGALVNSELSHPVVSVINVTQRSGPTAAWRKSGGKLTITPDAAVHGRMTFDVSVSDVADLTRADRIVHATVTLNVLGVPDPPGTPVVGRTVLSKSVQLSWSTPANNGAPIDLFEVSFAGGTQNCAASPCLIKGLHNGTTYVFKIRAKNVVGWGKWSPDSAPAVPNAVPGAVTGLTTSTPLDHTLKISWGLPPNEGTAVLKYNVTWSGGGQQTVTGTSFTAGGLDNDTVYTFQVIAINALGPGPGASVQGQSGGAPATPPAPSFSSTNSADSSSRSVLISWPAIDPNGPGPTTYTLLRTGGGSPKTVCAGVTATSCPDDGLANDGTIYSYSLIAANADAPAAPGPHTSKEGPATRMEASATPDPITGLTASPTGTDGQARIRFNVGASHGATSTVSCTANGGSCGTWTFPTGGSSGVTQTVNGLSNGASTTISLRDCNGSQGLAGSGSACNSPVTTTVVTYGPIKNPAVSASANGTGVNFTVSVNPNGKPATVHVVSAGQNQTFTTGTGPWSWSSVDKVGYNATDTITITVSDSGRATVSATGSATTGPPPTTVTVSKGRPCGAGGGAPCPQGSCISTSCAFLHLQTTNFVGSYTCSFFTNYNGGGGTWSDSTFGSNINQDLSKWFGAPGFIVRVTCSNASQSAVGQITWF
ncbi:MAG TPA: Ig-like domain-containing protein [Micromonosporaceae bacterium]|nr:Ig-like domain-containing protein [Micromonosporaceae bacterium]